MSPDQSSPVESSERSVDGPVRIRRYESGDAPALQRLDERALRAVPDFEYVEREREDLQDVPGAYLDRGGAFVVAEWTGEPRELDGDPCVEASHEFERVEPGAVVGCGGFRPWSEDVAELRRMRVTPALQGTGVGRALLDRLETTARERGFERCVLETMRPLRRARAFYERAGYRETCREAFHWGQMVYFRREL